MENELDAPVDLDGDFATEGSDDFEPGDFQANEGDTDTEGATEASEEPRYTVKIDGEEQEVTLDELLNGYQRQGDYTRKTQELAAEREQLASLKALQEALNNDPLGTIQALQQAFGVNQPLGAEAEELDPIERELAELKQWRATQEEQARLSAIRTEAASAKAAHKLEVSDEQLIGFAYENQIGNLNAAARLLKAEQMEQARTAKVQQTTEQKRQAAVIEGAGSRNRKAGAPPQARTLAEAFRQAELELS